MKRSILLTIVSFTVSWSFLAAATVERGMTLSEVRAVLGPEIGSIETQQRTVLMFDNGEVVFEDGLVARSSLVSDEVMAEREERRLRHQAEWAERQAQQRELRIEEGTRLKEDRLASGAFRSLPARDQVRFWRNFQTRFPEVDVSDHLALALNLQAADVADAEREAELRHLRNRLADAENSARRAEASAEQARRDAEARSSALHFRHTTPYYVAPVQRPITVIHTGQQQKRGSSEWRDRRQNWHNRSAGHQQNWHNRTNQQRRHTDNIRVRGSRD